MATTPLGLWSPKKLASPFERFYTVPAGTATRIISFSVIRTTEAEAAISVWLKPATYNAPADLDNCKIVSGYTPIGQSTKLTAVEGHILNAGDEIWIGKTGAGDIIAFCSGVEFSL